jgi:antitoxin PrlF
VSIGGRVRLPRGEPAARPLDRAGKTSYHAIMGTRGTGTIATSKLTSKAQTVVPREIRERLGLRPGDTVRYRVTKAGVVIDKRPETEDDPFVEFIEWASAEDEEAFKDL